MMNKKTLTTLTLVTALIEECMRIHGSTTCSEAIICALADFLLLPPSEQRLDTFALHQLIPNVAVRKNTKSVPIRIPRKLLDVILTISDCNTDSETVTMMISRTLYIAYNQAHSALPCLPLLHIWGNKWNNKMQDAIMNIKNTAQGVSWVTSVETCAGGLGIYANFKFADTEILNDSDWNIVNLYRAVQENPRELIAWARSLNTDIVTFEQQKTLSIKSSSKVDYEAAARCLFLNRNSFKSKGGTALKNMSKEKYHKVLASIYPLHQRLNQCITPQGLKTKLCNEDIFKIIDRYRKQENVLFIIDPPYLDADIYNAKKSEFGESEHRRLANLLRLVKQNNGNDFLYFCRITAPKRYQNMPNTEEFNRHMQGCIDDLYYGHGFYYVDVRLDATTTERIITSFDFAGATLYGKRGEC